MKRSHRPSVPGGLSPQLAFLERVQAMGKDKNGRMREPWEMEPHELLARTIAASATVSYDSANYLAEHIASLEAALVAALELLAVRK